MGGAKKRPISKAEKNQPTAATPAEAAASAKSKKPEKAAKPAKGSQQKESAVLLPRLDDKEALKVLSPLKAITIYGVSRAFSINASVANSLIRSLEVRKILHKKGGYSGHYVYALADQSPKPPG